MKRISAACVTAALACAFGAAAAPPPAPPAPPPREPAPVTQTNNVRAKPIPEPQHLPQPVKHPIKPRPPLPASKVPPKPITKPPRPTTKPPQPATVPPPPVVREPSP